ncbi:MAG: Gfo/Idh/MocA family oxidoreductase, partial [Deltaproteobacteria bacterium]|nr:Gfo/Idh/MocA family oxidoreductase [Deltaproteobacteria bacterium]
MGNIPKILVAGCGSWGKNLARNLHELGVLHSLCDSSKERLSEISSKYPGVHAFSSVEEALKTGGFSAVVVATPAATHYPLGKLFLEAGYDVFIEKPLALTARQGEELLQIAERNSKIIFVGHILLYHPAVSALKSLVSGGELGKVQYIYSNRLNLGKVRKEENILWSFAPHDIAIILHLLGEAPCSAAAFGGYYLNSNIADVTVTHLDFPSGVKAHIFVSWLHPYKDQRLIVIGDKKMAVFNDTAKDGKLSLYKHSFKWIDRLPVPEQGEREVIDIGDKEPLRLECMAFVESLETRVKPQTDGKEGLDVLKILAGCEESLQSNGKVVRFAPEPAPAPEAPKPGFFIHPSAFIDENVDIGDGTKIWHFCHVMKNTRIGQNCVLGQNVFLA